MKYINNVIKLFLAAFAVFQFSCLSEFSEPIMPEWDVSLTVPIVKDYTLGEITDDMDDSRISFDPQNDSMLIYKTSLSINPIQINNPAYIKLNSPTITGKISLSDIDFKLKEGFLFESKLSDFLPSIPINSNVIIPSISGLSSEKYLSLNSFNQITIDNAEFDIEITNQFPVDITINNMTLKNNKSGNTSDIIKKTNIQINKNSTQIITENISNKEIFNALKLSVTLSTTGTGTSSVYIDANSSLKISFVSKKVKILYAEASFDEQIYTFSVSSSLNNLGKNVQIDQAKIKNGQLSLSLKNYSSISGKFSANSPQLTYNSSSFNTGDISLSYQSVSSKSYNISDYLLTPVNKSKITMNNTVIINSTNNQMVKIFGTDSITYSINIKEIELASFSGSISGIINQSFWLPKDDVDKYFNGNVTLKNASASIVVNNGSNLPFNISGGIISGYNKKTGKTHTMNVGNSYINPVTSTRINLDNTEFTNFLNQFSSNNALPEYFNYSTSIEMTTNNNLYTFSNKDTIGGYVDLKVPLFLSISRLSYIDSADVTFSDSEKKEMNKVNYGKLTIRIANQVPMGGNLKITFCNSSTGKKLVLPLNYSSTQTGFTVSSGQINSAGYSSGETISNITEGLSKEEIVFLSNSDKCVFEILLNSASSSTVFLKREDKIKINLISEFGYRISEN